MNILKCIIPMLALLLFVLAAPVSAAKSYSADRFDVDIVVQPDGSAQVTETVAFRFEGGPFTFAFRGLPTRYTDGLSDFRLTENGRAYIQGGTAPGQYQLTTKRASVEARWHFEETSDAVRTFTLSYRVAGVMRVEGTQAALRWGALPPDHDYDIASSRVAIQFPNGADIQRAEILEGDGTLNQQGQTVTVTAQDIRRDRELVVGVWAPRTAFTGLPPAWQVEENARAAADRTAGAYGVLAGMLILAVGLPALFIWRSRVPAHPPISQGPPIYTPPDTLPPAIAGALAKDESGAGLSTLLQLAQRGVVEVRETRPPSLPPNSGGWGGWRGQQPDIEFVLRDPSAPLQPFEQAVVAAAFSKAKQPGVVSAKEMGEGLQKGQGQVKDAINAELQARGFIDPTREAARTRFFLAAGGLFLAALVIGLPLIGLFRTGGVGPLFAFGALSFIAMLLGASLSRLSAVGAQVADQWSAFKKYLDQVARGKTPLAPGLMDPYLPYAAAFGLEQKWVKRFSTANVATPAWFRTTSSTPDASWVAFSGAIHSASSSAGAGAASAASAGAAGGGSSGAG